MSDLLQTPVSPDWEGFLRCLRRDGMPDRVHTIELFLDGEVKDAICRRYGLYDGIDPDDPFAPHKVEVRVQRFLGYDYVRCGLEGMEWPFHRASTEDTAEARRAGGRSFIDETAGPITNWEEFEAYPWPDPTKASTRSLEWFQENLPEDMCIVGGGGFAHFAEHLMWVMGYQTCCFALYDQRDLVKAISDRLIDIFRVGAERILQFDRVKAMWGSDDLGYRSGTLIGPDDTREFLLPGHKLMAEMSHAAGRPYLLHSCGNLRSIMEDLIEDVKIDAKHSFEDVIEPVTEAKESYGDRIALLGGIDVDFLCTSTPDEVRSRVRHTLDRCLVGGGYCLGTGNSVANYIPLENYLTMLDEGRRYRV